MNSIYTFPGKAKLKFAVLVDIKNIWKNHS